MEQPYSSIRAFTIHICNDCLDLKGECCNTPECAFCRRSMEEVKEYLNVLAIRPLVFGEPLFTDRGRKVNLPAQLV